MIGLEFWQNLQKEAQLGGGGGGWVGGIVSKLNRLQNVLQIHSSQTSNQVLAVNS